MKEAARRYSPAEVVAVSREVESGTPGHISTSYVERQNLTLRMTQKRFARLTNGFSKKLDHHSAAVSLYVAHYNLCRVHEALRTTPAVALGVAERVWTIGDLLDAVLPLEPNRPVVRVTRNFTVIDGGEGLGPPPKVVVENSTYDGYQYSDSTKRHWRKLNV
ncbi:hypothetical protein [Bradyrhizobium sp. CER78]|uniref:hypothetical protein n=1 Tax=Bradyrhizobium sp. CER78 TaxID=3039162 RepID=UPI00244BB533|nr:hypothetical protein [Bradyrhizobium sp. CER78]MDH2385494.1 hypothetical protein [Bradyrhizobium sp. CER78]